MKILPTFCCVLSLTLNPGSGIAVSAESKPQLVFDNRGNLVLAVAQDGRRCVYRYGADGELLNEPDPGCGLPGDWLD